MDAAEVEFGRRVGAVVRRFLGQNGAPVPADADVAGLAARLWAVVRERGLPPPPAPGDPGAPREMAEAEVAPLAARVLAGAEEPLLGEAVRQLLKACLYPEFTVCRESYHAAAADGACRRQEVARVRRRISGSHCVDCPYWRTHAAEAHAELLGAAWRAGPAGFAAVREMVLPEDFRALRVWIRDFARRTAVNPGA